MDSTSPNVMIEAPFLLPALPAPPEDLPMWYIPPELQRFPWSGPADVDAEGGSL